jgi:NAD-dependent DNA ligase
MNQYDLTIIVDYITIKYQKNKEILKQLVILCIKSYLQYDGILDILEYFIRNNIIYISDNMEIELKQQKKEDTESEIYKKKYKIFLNSISNKIFIVSDSIYEKLKEIYGYDDVSDIEKEIESSNLNGNLHEFKYIMGSLRKFRENSQISVWNSFKKKYNEFIITLKIDGCSLYLEYESEKKFTACTRGNGDKGSIINDKIQHLIKKYSSALNEFKNAIGEDQLILRGELFTHDRNVTAGILNSKSLNKIEELNILFYECFNFPEELNCKYFDILKFMKAYGLPIVPFIKPKKYEMEIFSDIYEKLAINNIPEDGLVITGDGPYVLDNIYLPKNRIAYKKIEEGYQTKVIDIQFQVGKTGSITPIITYEPLKINDKTYTTVTASNINRLKELGLNRGSIIWIQIANKIIPYIVKSIPSKTPFIIPDKCTECGFPLTEDFKCNNNICYGIINKKIETFMSTYITKGKSKALSNKITTTFMYNILSNNYDEDDKIEFDQDGRCKKYSNILLKYLKMGYPAIIFKYLNLDILMSMGFKKNSKTIGNIYEKLDNFKKNMKESSLAKFISSLSIQGLGEKQVQNIIGDVMCKDYKTIDISTIDTKKVANRELVSHFNIICDLLNEFNERGESNLM